jgi:hypothetical protein
MRRQNQPWGKQMNQFHAELQRLFRLLAETALKLEQDAYAAGWKDCRTAMIKAVYAINDVPPSSPNAPYRYESDSSAAHENIRSSASAS